MSKPLPTAEYIRSILNYDPESGLFTNKTTRNSGAKAGDVAGSLKGRGYIEIQIDGKLCKAHRLAWLIQTGEWPENEVDHINNVKSDNRWINLRAATHAENLQNVGMHSDNKSGFKGVSWHKNAGKWRSCVCVNGKSFHLGLFDDLELAALSHAGAARLLFGDFSHATINITINNFYDKEQV